MTPGCSVRALALSIAGLLLMSSMAGAVDCSNGGTGPNPAGSDGGSSTNTACGGSAVANGGNSTAIGNFSLASGSQGTALGSFSAAKGSYSTAVGWGAGALVPGIIAE